MPSKVYRSVHTTPLISNSEPTNVGLVFDAVMKKRDIALSIQRQHLQGLNTNVKRLFDFSNSPDYFYGQFTIRTWTNFNVQADVIAVLETIEGESITVDTFLFNTADEIFFAEELIDRLYGYDKATKVVTNPPFAIAADTVVTFSDADFVEGNLDISYSVQLIDASPPTITVVNATLTDLTLNNPYFMVTYFNTTTPTVLKYWIYDTTTNVYPELTDLDVPLDLSKFLPVIPLRVNKHTLISTDGGYADSVEALDMIDVDFDELISAVSDNPDIDDIEDVSVQFSADLESTNPVVQSYLYEFFYELMAFPRFLQKSTLDPNETTLYANAFYMRLQSENLFYAFSVKFIDEKIHIGTFTDAVTIYPRYANYTYTTNLEGPYVGKVYTSNDYSDSMYVIRKQLTEDTYSELTIGNIRTTHYANALFEVMNDRNKTVSADVALIGESNYTKVVIPVSLDTLERFSPNPVLQNDVLKATLILQINTRSVVDIAWYETKVFEQSLNAVLLAIAVMSFSPELIGIAEAASIYIAAEMAFYLVVDYYLTTIAIEYALEFLVKEFGLEATFWAIAAAVVVAALGKGTDALTDSISVWADDLLKASLAILAGLSQPINDALTEIMDDTADFLKSAEEQQDEIDRASDLLGTDGIDPFDIIMPPAPILINESPTQFYSRTIHTGNPGVQSLDVIGNYIDNSLKLPDLTI